MCSPLMSFHYCPWNVPDVRKGKDKAFRKSENQGDQNVDGVDEIDVQKCSDQLPLTV